MIGRGPIRVGCLEAIGIPTLTAFISGVVFGLFVASMSLWSDDWIERRWLIALTFSLGGIVIALPFSFSFWGRLLAGPDHSRPKMQAYSYTTTLEIHSNDDRTINIVELPVSPDQLRKFARGVLAGRSLAEAAWIGDSFTRAEFVAMRDELIIRGLAEWNSDADRARGWQLTRPGMAAMRHFAGKDTTPPTQGFPTLKVQEVP